jgi:hypothetical protein
MMTLVGWYSDLRSDFPGLGEEHGNRLFSALREVMGDPGTALVHRVEVSGEEGLTELMVVAEDDTRLITYANEETTVEFLGSLAGASTMESITFIERGYEVKSVLRHKKLGDRTLGISRQALSPHESVRPRFGEFDEAVRWDRMRAQFRAWASSRTPAEQPSDDSA